MDGKPNHEITLRCPVGFELSIDYGETAPSLFYTPFIAPRPVGSAGNEIGRSTGRYSLVGAGRGWNAIFIWLGRFLWL